MQNRLFANAKTLNLSAERFCFFVLDYRFAPLGVPLNLASIVIQILKSNFTYVLIPIFFLNNLFCSYLKHSTKI